MCAHTLSHLTAKIPKYRETTRTLVVNWCCMFPCAVACNFMVFSIMWVMAVAHKYFVVYGYSVKVLKQAQTHAFVVAGKFMLLRTMMMMEMIVKFRMKDFPNNNIPRGCRKFLGTFVKNRENLEKIDSTLTHRKEKKKL